MILLGKQHCGTEPWTRKQRDIQEIETIKVRFLRPTLESKILERLRISNIPKEVKRHKILGNLNPIRKIVCINLRNGQVSLNCYMFQAEIMTDAAFVCEWVRTLMPFQLCLIFIIIPANKEYGLTAGKFVPVSNLTTFNVCSRVKLLVTNNTENVYTDIRQKFILLLSCIRMQRNYHRGFVCHNKLAPKNNVMK
jgi:hypothetical protein